ncbi:MAG TPA: hypothetical protein VHQ90_05630 [Thermoanaerobaculia bacterium]|nr:hypothetical protein [Thermoanaerobaculia bacterium]
MHKNLWKGVVVAVVVLSCPVAMAYADPSPGCYDYPNSRVGFIPMYGISCVGNGRGCTHCVNNFPMNECYNDWDWWPWQIICVPGWRAVQDPYFGG